jgi:hypothetical protein
MVNVVSDGVVGFGPIEFLLKDPEVTEVIRANGPNFKAPYRCQIGYDPQPSLVIGSSALRPGFDCRLVG